MCFFSVQLKAFAEDQKLNNGTNLINFDSECIGGLNNCAP